MAKLTVHLEGGPCDGTTKQLTSKQFYTFKTKCKGATYNYDPDASAGQGKLVFVAKVGSGVTTTPSFGNGQMHKGWGDVQHSVNKNLPAALHRSQRLHAATLRTLSRARRVKL